MVRFTIVGYGVIALASLTVAGCFRPPIETSQQTDREEYPRRDGEYYYPKEFCSKYGFGGYRWEYFDEDTGYCLVVFDGIKEIVHTVASDGNDVTVEKNLLLGEGSENTSNFTYMAMVSDLQSDTILWLMFDENKDITEMVQGNLVLAERYAAPIKGALAKIN